MRVIALGGAGGMGRRALEVLAAARPVDHVVVADLDLDGARTVAANLERLGQPASAQAIDVTDAEALRALLSSGDLVMNSVGPYFRFGLTVLEAAIDAGIDYIDICDDAEPTVAMLALHERAAARGVTAVIGAGASPGFMNVLALVAARGLDRVDDITVGWTLTSMHHSWDMMRVSETGGMAAAVHLLEEFTGDVPAVIAGAPARRRTRDAVRVDVPGLGRGTGYVVGHPEPVTLPRTLNAHGDSVSVLLVSSNRAAVLHETAAAVERGELSLEQALAPLLEAIGTPPSTAHADRYPDGGDLPVYFVLIAGTRAGEPVWRFAGCVSKPEAMSEGTGVPYGVAAAFVASNALPAGVYPLDAVIDPDPYLAQVAAGWGVPLDDLFFTGTAPRPTHDRANAGQP